MYSYMYILYILTSCSDELNTIPKRDVRCKEDQKHAPFCIARCDRNASSETVGGSKILQNDSKISPELLLGGSWRVLRSNLAQKSELWGF